MTTYKITFKLKLCRKTKEVPNIKKNRDLASSMSGQDEPNCALLVATRRVPREKFPQKQNYKSFIDQLY